MTIASRRRIALSVAALLNQHLYPNQVTACERVATAAEIDGELATAALAEIDELREQSAAATQLDQPAKRRPVDLLHDYLAPFESQI